VVTEYLEQYYTYMQMQMQMYNTLKIILKKTQTSSAKLSLLVLCDDDDAVDNWQIICEYDDKITLNVKQ